MNDLRIVPVDPSLGIIYDDFMAQIAGACRVPLDRLRGRPGMATITGDQDYYGRIEARIMEDLYRGFEFRLQRVTCIINRAKMRRYRRFKGIRRPRFARRDK